MENRLTVTCGAYTTVLIRLSLDELGLIYRTWDSTPTTIGPIQKVQQAAME